MKIPRLAAALALALAPSCSPADVDPACQSYAFAYCARLKQCSPTALQMRFGTAETCEMLYQTPCINGISLPSSGSTVAGREACTSALADWDCTDFIFGENPPPACAVASGALPNGVSCATASQCQSGYCGFPAGSACGTCAPEPQPGDSCAITQCPSGLSCANPPLTCQARAGAGASCAAPTPCDDGLVCVSGTCEIAVTMLNAPCNADGAGCDIYSGLGCSGTPSACTTATLAQPGQPCGEIAGQTISCFVGNCTRGVCVGLVAAGGACEIDGAPCMSNTRCVVPAGSTTGTCQFSGSALCD
jgi:hypothetical protein